MIDPVTAFSLAGTILQFLECGTKLIATAGRLKKATDRTDEHVALLNITEDLKTILPKLKAADTKPNTDVGGLDELALNCGRTAERLVGILKNANVGAAGNVGRRDAIKGAFQLLQKGDEIRSLDHQLSAFRDQLNLHLLVSLREHASNSVEQREKILRKLGVVHDETMDIDGICSSILNHMISNHEGKGQTDRDLDKRNMWHLRHGLVEAMLEDQVGTGEPAVPPSLQLSETDLKNMTKSFLEILQYEYMVDRESRVAEAHEKTFQWVFDNNRPQRVDALADTTERPGFRDWLEGDQQLYWITGKAGSGKSTLMKFLCRPTAGAHLAKHVEELSPRDTTGNCRCFPYLKKWAGSSRLVIASFYFWNSGTELQTTADGLFRTLLYQLVQQRPDIVPVIAPLEWEVLCFFGPQGIAQATSGPRRDHFSMLVRAIQALGCDSKICLFIDGLDEFGGNHNDLISMVKDLTRISHVKVCVASRPWNIFQDAFGQQANLRLEDLTYQDIKNFVESEFESNTEFEKLKERYDQFANKLVETIVVKAAGVFLWVDIVVKSLLAGIGFGDRIGDLQRRLDELPPDLENLYKKILRDLEPRYLEHAVQYFDLIESSQAPLTITQFYFADELDPESAIRADWSTMTTREAIPHLEGMNRRLNSRCKGLLETDSVFRDSHTDLATVQYLHATVRDFIRSRTAQEFLSSFRRSDFDPHLQMCVAYVMHNKKVKPQTNTVLRCLESAARVTEANEGAMIRLLDELKMVIPLTQFGHQRAHILRLAVERNVVPYVRARAERGYIVGTIRPHRKFWPLLVDALRTTTPNPRMVECLLDLGADPNFDGLKLEPPRPTTRNKGWMVAMFVFHSVLTAHYVNCNTPSIGAKEWKETFELLIQAGADPQVLLGAGVIIDPCAKMIIHGLMAEKKAQNARKGWWRNMRSRT